MREREQVDRDPARATLDPRRRIDATGDGFENRMTRGILRVDDTTFAVPRFSREIELAGRVAIEANVEFVEEQLLHCGWAFAHELLDRRRIRGAVAGVDDVPGERGGIRSHIVNNSSLRPITIRSQRLGETEQLD